MSMVIVESHKEWEKFMVEFEENDSVVIPIQCDVNKHPIDTELCLFYIRLLNDSTDEYVLPFKHSDTINLDNKYITLTRTSKNVYTYDKKKLLHFVKWENVCDIQLMHYLRKNEPLMIDEIITNAHQHFYTRFYKFSNLNCVVPVLKHVEWCREVVDKIKVSALGKQPTCYETYNFDVLESLQYIEQHGLMTKDGLVYSEYNPYTTTGRPSNRFGGTNFAALNKTDGSREKYISRFDGGMLVEMDYDAYHLRLIGDVVDYKFPNGSVHKHMAKFYGCDYEESKKLSFKYLYGHIPIEVVQLNPFFGKVHDYIEKTWKTYKDEAFITSDIYNKRIYRDNLSEMNKNKVFNYLIQLMETENNMKVLAELIPKIENYESKLVLYSYDSFLFDFKISDGLGFIGMVKDILEQGGMYPVKIAKGQNYHKMENITDKFND